MLNKDNYYSKEMNARYMSVSSFKSIMECEAKYIAEQDGLYERPSSNALIVGNYIHTAFENKVEHSKFIDSNKEIIFNKKEQKYEDFKQADRMIDKLMNDDFCIELLQGEKEVIHTCNLYGMDWKIRVDNLNVEKGFFSDIKTTKSLYDRYWSEKYNSYVPFVMNYDYIFQMYLYQQVLSEMYYVNLKPYIVAVTKEKNPDIAVIEINQSRLENEFNWIYNNAERVRQVWKREVMPVECGKCDYCRKNKKLNRSSIIEVGELLK